MLTDAHARTYTQAYAELQQNFASTTHKLCDRVTELEAQRLTCSHQNNLLRLEEEKKRERENLFHAKERRELVKKQMESVEESERAWQSKERALWREWEELEREGGAQVLTALALLDAIFDGIWKCYERENKTQRENDEVLMLWHLANAHVLGGEVDRQAESAQESIPASPSSSPASPFFSRSAAASASSPLIVSPPHHGWALVSSSRAMREMLELEQPELHSCVLGPDIALQQLLDAELLNAAAGDESVPGANLQGYYEGTACSSACTNAGGAGGHDGARESHDKQSLNLNFDLTPNL